ncbi:Cullin-3 [Fusarium oxysporum f. sp. albedinis]|nr:Cullin-3 [Fusarium oxysporum f. sp. albedinis]
MALCMSVLSEKLTNRLVHISSGSLQDSEVASPTQPLYAGVTANASHCRSSHFGPDAQGKSSPVATRNRSALVFFYPCLHPAIKTSTALFIKQLLLPLHPPTFYSSLLLSSLASCISHRASPHINLHAS